MGQDKATLLFEGEPLWQIQLNRLRRLNPLEILVSARTDPLWLPPDIEFVPDLPPSRGPLSGLTASLSAMRGTHLLALAVDMPWMNESCLNALCRQIGPSRGLLPMIETRAEPLAAVYPREAFPDLTAALCGNDFSLQRIATQLVRAGRLRVIPVTKQEERFYRSLNEPADVARSQ